MTTSARIDSHHHMIFPGEVVYPFLDLDRYRPLKSRASVEEFVAASQPAAITHSVVVQASPTLKEGRLLLEHADHSDRLAGVVAWIDLVAGDARQQVSTLRSGPGGHKLVGIRHNVHDEPSPDWLLDTRVLDRLAIVAQEGLCYDLLLRPRDIPAAVALARLLPELSLVVDHLAKPRIMSPGSPLDSEWLAGIEQLAQFPQVWCKLSGLVAEMNDATTWSAQAIDPYLDTAVELFGPDRLMFGSDWPVCTLDATYTEVVALIENYCLARLGAEATGRILGANAVSFYRLQEILDAN